MEAVSKCLAFSSYKAREDEELQGGRMGGKLRGGRLERTRKNQGKRSRTEKKKRKKQNQGA